MKYMLSHKNIPVLEIEIPEAVMGITDVGECFSPEHLPVGVGISKGKVDRSKLNDWWSFRCIPSSRAGLRDALFALKIGTPQRLLTKCFGLSLADQYWINPKNNPLDFENINFFNNTFSEDIGKVLFGEKVKLDNINFMSPDNTTDGWLRKKWKIIDGKRCLIKGGSKPFIQEPYNEALASAICRRLNINHIPYNIMIDDEIPYSVCENFVTKNTELITAWYVMQTQKQPNHISVYQHYLNCCNSLGIPDITVAIDQMLSLDFIIANEDRHLNNFGVIRNADTLKYVGASPIFDSGTSVWYSQLDNRIRPMAKNPSKPFRSEHSEQIKLIKSFEWLDFSKLKGIDEEFSEIVKNASPFIDNSRHDKLIYALTKRIEMLMEIAQNHTPIHSFDKTEFDLEEDIAYSGEEENQTQGMQLM